MADHQALDHMAAEIRSLLVVDGDDAAIARGCHAGHDHGARLIVGIAILFHGTLPARANRTHAWMPAEIG